MSSKFVYFTSLILENVRAFGDRQELLLTSGKDVPSPAQWTLIIGENGVGKTTLLQCLAKMRPVPTQPPEEQNSDSSSKNTSVQPAFADARENEEFEALARSGKDVHLNLEARLSIGTRLDSVNIQHGESIFTSLTIERKDGEVKKVTPGGAEIADFEEPLVIGYGASRHMGYANSSQIDFTDSVASLFDSSLELVDAEEILQQLDYSRVKKVRGAGNRLNRLTAALATILPHIGVRKNIEIHPRTIGLKGKKGVYARTPSGLVPFSSLSLGYQTVSAWTIDIALRLFQKYPESANPLSEPAIVLVDEIDLHLHPKWQRQIRRDLSAHFPNIQFIATAHSPLMAQTYLDANLAVIRLEHRLQYPLEDYQAVIVNDPLVIQDWRLDQVITSELFGFDSARPPEVEAKMQRQVALIRKTKKTAAEKRELQKLDRALEGLPSEESHADKEAMEIIRRATQALKQ